MRKVYLLDCTLRDGGYVNDWRFGEDAIRGIAGLIANTGIEMIEMGFVKGDLLDKDRSVFPDVESITPMITPKFSPCCDSINHGVPGAVKKSVSWSEGMRAKLSMVWLMT